MYVYIMLLSYFLINSFKNKAVNCLSYTSNKFLDNKKISLDMSLTGDDRGVQNDKNKDDNCNIESWLKRIDSSIARSRKIKGGNYVQIATVDSNGLPRCRTVVFRGLVNLPNNMIAMKMITDMRSEKVDQIANSPACELVWWFRLT